MTEFRYKNNAIRKQKVLKPIVHANIADTGVISLTEEPVPCRKRKTLLRLKVNE